jgi:hypothetical protein
MATEGQSFFKNDQPNPWLISRIKSPITHASY